MTQTELNAIREWIKAERRRIAAGANTIRIGAPTAEAVEHVEALLREVDWLSACPQAIRDEKIRRNLLES